MKGIQQSDNIVQSSKPLEHELVQQLNESGDKLLFLSEIRRVLSTALTESECFNRLLELVVPKMADWATLNIIYDQGEIQRVAVRAADPEKNQVLETHIRTFHPSFGDATGAGYVIRQAKSELETESKFIEHAEMMGHPEWAKVIQTLGIKSRITVPLKAHEHILGALWLATSESNRVFTERDLKLAEEIATRAAYAAYNQIRYLHASKDNQRLQIEADMREHYLSQLRHDVLSALTSAQLSAQMIQRIEDQDKKNDFARRIDETISKVASIIRSVNKRPVP
jgi:GAF domain-containing protein